MYRLLVFIVILNMADSHCGSGGHCGWRHNHNHTHMHGFRRGGCGHHHHHVETPQNFPGTTFEDIARNVIKIDTAIKKFCEANNINRTSEIYGNDNYILKYHLPEFKEEDMDVKIMNKVIYTTATSTNGDVKSFKDLRILPDVVSVADAKWIVEHKTLKVLIPYKANWRHEVVKDCSNVIDETIKSVPKMAGSGFGFRSNSDDSDDNAVIHFEQNEIS